MRTSWKWLVLLLAIVAAVGVYRETRWKRFATVSEGKVYRSGLLKEWQLERAIESYGLKTVVCLAPIAAAREQAVCRRHGVELISFDMHSSGSGRPEDYAAVVRAMSDPRRQPLLVHCEAGVARTGAATALYRMAVEGWSFDAALAELKSFERKGRCSPELQAMIQRVFREQELAAIGGSPKKKNALNFDDLHLTQLCSDPIATEQQPADRTARKSDLRSAN